MKRLLWPVGGLGGRQHHNRNNIPHQTTECSHVAGFETGRDSLFYQGGFHFSVEDLLYECPPNQCFSSL